jgi:hypothetical protein
VDARRWRRWATTGLEQRPVHRGQVERRELLQRDAADVRDDVESDVALVRAVGSSRTSGCRPRRRPPWRRALPHGHPLGPDRGAVLERAEAWRRGRPRPGPDPEGAVAARTRRRRAVPSPQAGRGPAHPRRGVERAGEPWCRAGAAGGRRDRPGEGRGPSQRRRPRAGRRRRDQGAHREAVDLARRRACPGAGSRRPHRCCRARRCPRAVVGRSGRRDRP